MDAYILAVCGAVILSALVTIVLPEGKTGKFIGGILRLFCLLVMLTPLLALLQTGGSGDVFAEETGAEIAPDDSFVAYMFGRRADEEERAVRERLSEEFGVRSAVQIGWKSVEYAYTVSKVEIAIEDFGIYGEDEHIFVIEQVRSRVSELYSGAEVTVHG